MTNNTGMKRLILPSLWCAAIFTLSLDAFAKTKQDYIAQRDYRRREALRRTNEQAKHQILIRLRSGVTVGAIKSKLPSFMAVSESQGALAVIQSQKVVSPEDIKMLLEIPGVEEAQKDSVVVTRQDPANCAAPDPSQIVQLPAIPASLKGCATSNVCPNSGKSKLWAQERIDADLMAEELTRMGIGSGTVKIAVVDSGFDLKANQPLMASPSLKVEKGHDKSAEPTRDEDGHGTMVASLVGGKDGIGIAPQANLTVYRVSESYSEGTATNAAIQLSIEKACAAGNEIINVSWGGLLDEAGIVTDEDKDKAFIESLAKRGCLVVKAAGNSAYRKRKATSENPDDAYLRVAAISDSGNISEFSTPGEISAPGSGVFTLESTHVPSDMKAEGKSKCGTDAGRFVNGTSFSAPIVAAIGAQVISVLKTGSKYSTLSGPDRIKLLNRILIASQIAGSANALRAALIAEQWVKKDSTDIPKTEDLAQLIVKSSPKVCAQQCAKCSTSTDCAGLSACVKESRRKLALCGNAAADDIADLIDTQISTENLESAAGVLHYFKANGASKEVAKKMAASAESLWNAYVARWSSQKYKPEYSPEINLSSQLDFDATNDVLSTYFKTEESKEKLKTILNTVFDSYDLHRRMSSSPDHGGEEDLSVFYSVFKTAALKLGTKDFKVFLKDRLRIILTAAYESSYDKSIVLARLFNTLIGDKDFESIKPDLLEMETRLFSRLNERNLTVSKHYLDYLEPMFTRNKDALVKAAVTAVTDEDYKDIGALQMLYLTKNSKILPADKAEKFFSGIIPQLSVGTVTWGGGDDEIAKNTMLELQKIVSAAKPANKKALVENFQTTILSSPAYRFIKSVFPDSYGDTISEYDLKEKVDKNPLLTRKFLYSLARQTALSIPKQPKKTNEAFQLDRNYLIRSLLPFLVSDPNPDNKEPSKFSAPVAPDSMSRNDLAKASKLGPINVENKSVSETLDSLLAFLIEDFREANQTAAKRGENQSRIWNGIDPVRNILDNKAARKFLSPDGEWKKSLQKLVDDADANKDRYRESLVIQLKKYLQ